VEGRAPAPTTTRPTRFDSSVICCSRFESLLHKYTKFSFHSIEQRAISASTFLTSMSSSQRLSRGSSPKGPSPRNKSTATNPQPSETKLRLKIRRFHAVAKWTWNVGDDEEDVCIVCQSAFEGVAPGVKFPGDECPVVWGKCGHAFHLQCVTAWLSSQNNNTCPICRQDWEFGAERRVEESGAAS
jgi:anaphase-promoting complex subunit 11